jgi:hypothetical protein
VVAVQCRASMMRHSSIGAFVVVAVLLLVLPGCRRTLCSDHVGQSVVSPDGRYIASVIQSECLAKEHATVVELRRNRLLLKDRRVVFLIGGFRNINVAWQDKNQLAIIAPTCEPKKIVLRNWKNDVTAYCQVAASAGVATGK